MAGPGSQPLASCTVRLVETVDEFAECLRVRWSVFVQEQGVPPEEELDAIDAEARHYVAIVDGRVVGTARTYVLPDGALRIGRLAIVPGYRRRGIATQLMQAVISFGAGPAGFVLDAQVPVIGFYETLGFRVRGEVFLDAGIAHKRMVRPAVPDGPSM